MSEQVWRDKNGKRHRPFSSQAQVRHRGCSRRLQRAMSDFGADEAFAKAAQKLREHYGLEVSESRVQRVSLAHARRMAQQNPGKACTTLKERGPEWIIAEADGTMVPVVDTAQGPNADRRKNRRVRWQEARVVAAQAHGQTRTHYDATLGEVGESGKRWSAAAGKAGWALNTRIHAIGDGAPWLSEQAKQRFGVSHRYTLDLYHVSEYLAAAWEGQKEQAREQTEALKRGEAGKVLEALEQKQRNEPEAEEQAPARRAMRYLGKRREQLDYPAALKEGLPIGSGLIESAHRHLLQARLKKAGAWWLPRNAHNMAQMRVCRANNLWDAYWLTCPN